MTNILGISAFYHDSAACVGRDGTILAAAQERIGKIKPLFTQAHLPASPQLAPLSPLAVPLSRRGGRPASAGRWAHGAGAPPRGGGTGLHPGGAGRPAADAGSDGVPHRPDQASGLWPGAGAPGGAEALR